jgi:chorismate mutase
VIHAVTASDLPETDGAPLEQLRHRIDELDDQIAHLLQERAERSLQVGQTKAGGESAPIFVPHR